MPKPPRLPGANPATAASRIAGGHRRVRRPRQPASEMVAAYRTKWSSARTAFETRSRSYSEQRSDVAASARHGRGCSLQTRAESTSMKRDQVLRRSYAEFSPGHSRDDLACRRAGDVCEFHDVRPEVDVAELQLDPENDVRERGISCSHSIERSGKGDDNGVRGGDHSFGWGESTRPPRASCVRTP